MTPALYFLLGSIGIVALIVLPVVLIVRWSTKGSKDGKAIAVDKEKLARANAHNYNNYGGSELSQ